MSDFSDYQTRVNSCLKRHLNQCDTTARLKAAMEYSVLNGGKRIRPILVYATTEALGGNIDQSDASACAVELIHAYSLIHDDLPAMDDDDLRRGKPTTHIKFDEATAILAGDALHSLAFEILAENTPGDTGRISTLACAAGPCGMVGGQMIDMVSIDSPLSNEALEQMHKMKTGALINASISLGVYHCESTPDQICALQQFGCDIGLAFQVRDDLLDELGEESQIGKTRWSDKDSNKPTYVSIHGIEGAQTILSQLKEQAISSLDTFDSRADTLRHVAQFIVARAS